MVPIRNYDKWNERSADSEEQIEPKKKYYIFAEGIQTERKYIESFIDNFSIFSSNNLVNVIFMEKTENDKGISNPKALVEFAHEEMKNQRFIDGLDKVVIVFDTDIYKEDVDKYNEVLNKIDEYGYIPAVTYPSIELFLLLHINDSFEKIIKPNEKSILENKTKSKNKTFIYGLCNQSFGFNVKKSGKVKRIVMDLKKAIDEEKKINQDYRNCIGKLSSNIGSVIKQIIDDDNN